MSRQVQISLAPHLTEQFINEIEPIKGVTGISLHKGVSLKPKGDVITVELTNPALLELMRRLEARGLGKSADSSIVTSELLSSVSSPDARELTREPSDAPWEEMESSLLKESNTNRNTLFLMFAAGFIAAVGVSTNTLHVVIGAMLIAPGFEPITRIALGAITSSQARQRGAHDLLRLYLALVLGAALATLMFVAMSEAPLSSDPGYLGNQELLRYWTSLTIPSTVVTALSAIAGAILVATNRSVLTAGVMTGLALVPAATITTMAMSVGDWTACGLAAIRWLVDCSLVLLLSMLVFAWKRRSVQGRPTMLL
ncbi:DUF389 domain-containing protein [Stutzerimonas zhaodongensis]|uniref:DUF389 domain-containing protein n=1 Tax=Stutzerimonas TaxID=2901164 RepID=UPI00388F4672